MLFRKCRIYLKYKAPFRKKLQFLMYHTTKTFSNSTNFILLIIQNIHTLEKLATIESP